MKTLWLVPIALLFLVIGLAGAQTVDVRNTPATSKGETHVGTHPGTPDGREGGENVATAVPISALPFYDTGNTCDNVHDYDETCPYSGSFSPDVIYSFMAAYNIVVDIDLFALPYEE